MKSCILKGYKYTKKDLHVHVNTFLYTQSAPLSFKKGLTYLKDRELTFNRSKFIQVQMYT